MNAEVEFMVKALIEDVDYEAYESDSDSESNESSSEELSESSDDESESSSDESDWRLECYKMNDLALKFKKKYSSTLQNYSKIVKKS